MLAKKQAVAVPAVVAVHPNAISLNLLQVAAVTGLLLWQVRTLLWEGKLPARKVGRNLVVLKSDVEAYMSALPTVAPKTDKPWMQKR